MTSKIIVNTIEADAGISSVTFNDTISGNVTGNVNSSGTSTFNVITGVSTIGVTTIHVTGINDLTYPTAGPLGRRNLIINGRFDVWQRGTSFTGNEYTADRWEQALSGGTATVSRQSFTLGQTEVPGNPVYYLQQSCSVGNGNCGIDQKIEDVRTGAGGPVTVSFWAKGTNPPGYGYWAMQLWQRFGTGGSPSGVVQNNKELTVTSEWKKYTFTYELESVSGKTLGDDNNHNVDLIIRQHADDDDTGAWELNLANVQVEFGRNATEFEHRSYGEELARCQRYYQIILDNDGTEPDVIGVFAGRSASTTNVVFTVPLAVPMRAEPSMTGSTVGTIYAYSGGARVDNGGSGGLTLNSNNEWTPYSSHVLLTAGGFTLTNDRIYNIGGFSTGAFWILDSEL
jgi:hypothetical protein